MRKKYQKTFRMTVIIICIAICLVIAFLSYTKKLISQSILTNLGEITKQDAEKLENKIQVRTIVYSKNSVNLAGIHAVLENIYFPK